MYNEDRKLEYIAFQTDSYNTKAFLFDLFETFAPYESEQGCDLVMQGASSLKPIIDDIVCKKRYPKMVGYYLRSYAKWCASNGIGVCSGIFDVVDKTLESCKTSMVSSPFHLRCVLEYLFGKPEWNDLTLTYRSFYWLLYIGIDRNDIQKLTIDMVDLDQRTISFDNKVFHILEDAVDDLSRVRDLTEFYVTRNGTTRCPRYQSDNLLRGITGDFSLQTMLERSSKKLRSPKMERIANYAPKYPGASITPLSIFESGMYYRMHRNEIAGIAIDYYEYAYEVIDRRGGMKARTITEKQRESTIINRAAFELTIGYEHWKHAFYSS